jgi:predicted nucleotidyltransferase
MNEVIARCSRELDQLCRRYRVQRLDIFGSGAIGDGSSARDLDFLVKFEPLPIGEYSNAYFGLLESLEELFHQPIDLVIESAISNPYFRQSVQETRKQLYAA